jgi:hypothetical protein
VVQARELLAAANCRTHPEDEFLMSPHDLEAWLQAARKELAAALRIMRHTRWPKGGACDALESGHTREL